MINAYMIEKMYPGKILLEGYPRNSVFFDETRRLEVKGQLGLSDMEVFIYMPTFRGILMERNEEGQKDEVESYLSQLDSRLNDNQVLFAKLHVLNASKIDFSKFSHVRPFPQGFELYDVINVADVLITDYSSVFFDFANSKRKIILFNYDEADYESYRGFYFPLSDLPFPKVQDIDELVKELNAPKDYDDSEFIERFCTYDSPDAVENICRCIFKGEDTCRIETIGNGNPNVLLFAGDLSDNESTRKLWSFLEGVDRSKYNFFITYKQWDENILNNHVDLFRNLPSDVEVLPLRFNLLPTFKEKLDYDKFISNKGNEKSDLTERLLKRSFIRQYSNFQFDALIDFDKNDSYVSLMFTQIIEENKIKFKNFIKSNFS
jgi:CDP-glycerol glycerophosphotransferase